MPDFGAPEWRDWVPPPAGSRIEHEHRMFYDSSYRKAMVDRKIKAEFLARICEAVDGPMAEFLHETFDAEVEMPDFDD